MQIRVLRLRQAVFAVAARRESGAAEVHDLHRLAQLTAHERKHLVGDFLDTVFAGLGDQPAYPGVIVSMTPELPDEPTTEQVEAWLELAELSGTPRSGRARGGGHGSTPPTTTSRAARPDAVAVVGTRWPRPGGRSRPDRP
ncbi:hypothetical protein NKG94_24440 [Micromonospora sp. M12]